MRNALCLYGQPRNYRDGFANLKNFLTQQNDIQFDVFFHVWYDENKCGEKYITRRDLPDDEVIMPENTLQELLDLYQPVDYCYDSPKEFDLTEIKQSSLYQHTRIKTDKEQYIHISQMYSRNRTRDLFRAYCEKNKSDYEFVVFTRFDFISPIEVKLHQLNPEFIYFSDVDRPSRLKSDNIIILNQSNFIKIFDVYQFMFTILNSHQMRKKCVRRRIRFELIIEEIIRMSILEHNLFNKIIYTNLLPNFH